jgi:hypothetical protein
VYCCFKLACDVTDFEAYGADVFQFKSSSVEKRRAELS